MKTTNWYEKDIDEVFEYLYDEVKEDEQFEALKYFMLNYPDLDIEWLEIFENFKYHLLINERIEDILFFVDWYSKKDPDDYHERYEFVEGSLVDYFLFKKDYAALQKRIEIIKQNPAPAYDTLTKRLLFQLVYHGLYDLAIDYAQAVWKPIDESPKLIGFVSYPFISTLYINNLQNYYESLLNNTSFDIDQMFQKAVEIGYDNDKELFNEVVTTIKSDLDIELIETSIQNKKDQHMYHLNIQFLKYMYREFKMPFVFSELIWQFIHTRKIFGKHGRKNWFYIDKKTLDKHIVDRYDNFLGSNELEIFGKVWGFPYLISFFNHFQLLSDEHSQLMLKNMEYFKKEMVQIASFSLWKMMFVFKWPKISDSVEDHLYQDFFESTFGIKDEDMKEHLSEFFPSFQETEEWNYQAEMKEKDLGTIVYSGDSPYKKEEPEIGRNAPCPCGSGKKYKNCCLNKKSD